MRDGEPEKKIETSEADLRGSGRKLRKAQVSGSNLLGTEAQPVPRQPELIEKMLERGNLLKGLQAVERNRGAAGVDGMAAGASSDTHSLVGAGVFGAQLRV